ncbi:hypothetical protein LMG18091_04440 [Ralstonia wenshanensis]|uniref:Uncharacterized protein n=1 Tax=Ralstonia wenshanensis TaxID=2842456 RepID=A0AAD2EVS8_9RALS|nr:hypothetical protein LMG18091_04440 [Ralstonia wenshanensis]
MALQLIAHGVPLHDVVSRVHAVLDGAEVFPIDNQHVGISIPTALLDTVGAECIHAALRGVRCYDLYSGTWGSQLPPGRDQ